MKKIISWYARNRIRTVAILVCIVMVVQFIGLNDVALGAGQNYFSGYDEENIVEGLSGTFALNHMEWSGSALVTNDTVSSEAYGEISLNESGHDISASVDLGGLEIDFSTLVSMTAEAEGNDVPSAVIDFQNGEGQIISSVTLDTSAEFQATASGTASETLSSDASIPAGTRLIAISLIAQNTVADSANTVSFESISLKIHDAAAPSCSVSYNSDWTNQDVVVNVTAADTDSGLESIYVDGVKQSGVSPYTFTVSAVSSYEVYSMDYAGKKSEVKTVTIDKIDKDVPLAPESLTLSQTDWANSDVLATVPDLPVASGSPEHYMYRFGSSGDWTLFPTEGLTVSNSGQYELNVVVADDAGNISDSISGQIKIDKESPVIGDIEETVSSGRCDVSLSITDSGLSGLKESQYAQGIKDAAFFQSGGGTDIIDNAFSVTTGGDYTIFAEDNAGNTRIETFTFNTAPSMIKLVNVTIEEDETTLIDLSVSDETAPQNLDVNVESLDTALIPAVQVIKDESSITLSITPAEDLSGGPVTINVSVTDELGETVSDSFTVTVTPGNDDPVAVDDTAEVDEDDSVRIDVLANDYDDKDAGDTLSILSPGTPQHGEATIAAGKIKYTPDTDFSGEDSFVYTLTDNNGGTDTAAVTVTVHAQNDAPVAADDTSQTQEDTPVLIDVLANDTDVDAGDTLTITSVGTTPNGTASVDNGQIRFTPVTNFYGSTNFTYTIEDTAHLTSTATVYVTVVPDNDSPAFFDLLSEYTTTEDVTDYTVTFSIKDIETPAESLMLQAVSDNESVLPSKNIKIEGLGDTSDAIVLKFTPIANKYGDVTITLKLGDGFSTTTETFILHIMSVNDPPVAHTDDVTYEEGQASIRIEAETLLSNDTDIDADTLTIKGKGSDPAYGTLAMEGGTDGAPVTAFIYTPNSEYDGQTSFEYVLFDGVDTDNGVCRLIKEAQNQAPSIDGLNSSYTMNEDTTKSITFSISDREAAVSSLQVAAWSGSVTLVNRDGIAVTNNGNGTCTIDITSMEDANGTGTINVSVSDGNTPTNASFSLTVNPMQDAPVAVDDEVYVPLSGSQTFSVLNNDYDADEETLTVSSWTTAGLTGTLTFNETTQKFTYTAKDGVEGIETFTYDMTDGTDTVTGTVHLTITDQGYPPELGVIADQYMDEDGTLHVTVHVTDKDAGEIFTFNSPVSSDETLVPMDDTHMSISNVSYGTYTLMIKPAADQYDSATITLTVKDSKDNEDSVSFALSVLPVNDAPHAVADNLSVNEDETLTFNPSANDIDAENDAKWVNYIEAPAHGVITRDGNTFTYTPHRNWFGSETLNYTVTDGQDTAASTATIVVNAVNDAPVAYANWLVVENTVSASNTINVLNNDRDIEGDTLSVSGITTPPQYGTVVNNGDGTITYTRTSTPADASDKFQYEVSDGNGGTSTAWVFVDDHFDASLNCDSIEVENTEDADPFTISLPISNPNGVDYEVTFDPTALGTFTQVSDTDYTFTPAKDANGYQAIEFTATGSGESSSAYIYLRLYAVNDAPVIDEYNEEPVTQGVPTSASCIEDSSVGVTFDVDFHDVDTLDENLTVYAYTTNTVSLSPAPLAFDITVTDHDDGTAAVTVIPSIENANGSTDIIVGVSDGVAEVTHTVNMTVTAVDDYPVAEAVSRTLFEDTSDTFDLVTPNTEVDGDEVVLTITSTPEHGTVVNNGDGTVTYTPYANYVGDDGFNYTVKDQNIEGDGKENSSSVTLHVVPVNDPPVITNLDYFHTTQEDIPVDIPLTVTDVDNAELQYSFSSANTTLVPVSNISIRQDTGNNMIITADPAEDLYGNTVITVTVNDGEATATGSFKLTVTPVNDPPVALDETVTVNEAVWPTATTSTLIDLSDNISDVDGTAQIYQITDVSAGKAVNNSGTVTYTVDGDFNGTATFKYRVMDSDGATSTGTVTVNVTPQNDPPVAENDEGITTSEDSPVNIDVLSNDSDAEGDALSVLSATNLNHGTVAIEADNTVTYTPADNYNGDDSFTYTVSDGNGGTASANVYVTVDPINDAPDVNKYEPDTGDWTMDEDSTASFHFHVTDPESDVNNLIITITSLDATKLKTAGILLTSGDDIGERILTVTPEKDATGVMPVNIAVTDGNKTTEKTFDITITPINDAPVIDAPAITTPEETAVNSQVTAEDVDSAALTFSLAGGGEPEHGSVVVNADGTYTYDPADDYTGTDSFTVSVSDGDGGTADGAVLVTVTPVNDDPAAADDTAETDEDTPVVVDVLSNDADPDLPYGDVLTIVDNIVATHGTVEIFDDIDGKKKLRYTPDEDWNGTEVFSYTINDSEEKSSTASVTVTVNAVNDAPGVHVVGNDTAETMEEDSIDIEVTLNDDIDEQSNPADEDVTVDAILTQPSNGAAVLKADNKTITYTPDENYNGDDSFTYRAIDATGETAEFTVTVTVTPYNDAPVMQSISDVSMDEEATTNVTVNVSDIEDLDGDLTVTAVHSNSALFGTVTASAVSPATDDGEFTLVLAPKEDMVGTAEITVTVTDSGSLTAQRTFSVTVNNVNDDPVAQDDTATVSEGSTVTIDVLDNDDVDLYNGGDTLSILSFPATTAMGTLEKVSVDGKEMLKFTATDVISAKTAQTVTFAYTMHDLANNATSEANVTVTINPTNDAPLIDHIADMVGDDKILEDAVDGTGDITFTVSDEEDDDGSLKVTCSSENTTLFPASNITLTDNGSGNWTIKAIPAADQYGSGTITVTVEDLGSPEKTSFDTFTVEVESVDDTPQDGNDSETVDEDGEIDIEVLVNDDPDYATQQDTLSVVSVTDPAHGTASINTGNKTIKYKPSPDYYGEDSFSYTMHDSQSSTNHTFTVTMTVTPINDAPVIEMTDTMAPRDGYSVWYEVNEGELKTGIPFTVKDVDDIDVSVDKASSKTRLVNAFGMTLVEGATVDDTVEYTMNVQPSGAWNGQTVITLTADDGELADTVQFLFIVNSVNATPVANDDALHINEDTLTTLDVLANDEDEDLATDDDEEILIDSVSVVSGGSRILSLEPTAERDGINIKTNQDYNGGPITLTYTIKDTENAVSEEATVTVYVDQVNDAPVTANDTGSTQEEQAVDIDVLANDSDVDKTEGINAHPENETLTIDRTGLAAPAHGTVVVVDNGGTDIIRYTPDTNFNGTDTFTYYAYDGEAKTLGTVSVSVSQVNDSPVAVNDSAETPEDNAVTVNVLENDSDPDQSALNENPANEQLSVSIAEAELQTPNHGSIVRGLDNKITYTPDANYYGSDSFDYYVVDKSGVSSKGTVNITVTPVNDLPEFHDVPEAMVFDEDGSDTKTFAVSDVETNEDQLIVTAISSSNSAIVKTTGVTFGRDGEGDRTVTVQPETNQNGGPVSITLQVEDADGGTSTCTFNVTVIAVNDPPVAMDVADSIDEDASYSIDWSTITSDADIATNGDSLSVSIGTGASHGAANVSGDNIVYTPTADWNGVDSFTYVVSDGEATDTGEIEITVNQINDAPVANNDSIATDEDTPVVIPVLSNDTDKDLDEALNILPITELLTISTADIVQPAHGSAEVIDDGGVLKIRYVPHANYNGSDSLTYTVTDASGAQATGTVDITVNQVNDNPTAVADSGSTMEHTPVSINVLENDTDVDTDNTLNLDVLHDRNFSVIGISFVGEGHGTISESGGVITLSPELGFNGIQKISYVLSDGYGGSASGLLTISVGSTNDAPVAVDDSKVIGEDHAAQINVLENDTDLDEGDTLTLTGLSGISDLPGEISYEPNGDVTFTPDDNYYGEFDVGYTVEDSMGATDTGKLTITVTSVNDIPTATDDTAAVDEDSSVTVNITTLIDDIDLTGPNGDELTVSVAAADEPKHGSLTVKDGQCTYEPDADWNGTDAFTYTVKDKAGAAAKADINLTVSQVNDVPVANDDLVSTDEDKAISIAVTANDSDKDTVPELNARPEDEVLSISVVQNPAHGQAVVNGMRIVYTPNENYNGPDRFTYMLSDGETADTAVVSITVKQVNDKPVALSDAATTNDEDTVMIDVLSNDTDVDTQTGLNGGILHRYSDFKVTGTSKPAHGEAVVNQNKVAYTPEDSFAGTDSFIYMMSDGHGATASATVTVTVLSANDPPATPVIKMPKEGTLFGGGSTVTVTWDGFDIDGDALTYNLEFFNGSEWIEAATGLGTAIYDFGLPDTLASITDLTFRVKAFDGQLWSDYGYSGKLIVDKDAPANIVVTMTKADGTPYTAGTWTNQKVTVKAVSVEDMSAVTFMYSLEDKAYVQELSRTVTGGVHEVYIQAADVMGNKSEFGGYLVKIDKLAPAVPDTEVSVSGTNALITFTLLADPGGSGNRYIVGPDGSRIKASQTVEWAAAKNGAYAFTIVDNVGNSTKYSVTVDVIDTTPPEITCDSGKYKIGDVSELSITSNLSFEDDKSGITARGYAISKDETYSGVYSSYSEAITFEKPGTYYIHAFAQNEFGLSTHKTFGPFIVAEAAVPVSESVDAPAAGDVEVKANVVADGAVKVRLPGGTWEDSLTLDNVEPGIYLVEIMDEDGNVSIVEVTITDEDIAVGQMLPRYEGPSVYVWILGGLGILILLLLLLWRNVIIQACVTKKDGSEKVLRTVRRLRRSRDTLEIKLKDRHAAGSEYGRITLSRGLTRRMKDNTLIVTVEDKTVFNITVADVRGRYTAEIRNWR